jgi:hypothetical protein
MEQGGEKKGMYGEMKKHRNKGLCPGINFLLLKLAVVAYLGGLKCWEMHIFLGTAPHLFLLKMQLPLKVIQHLAISENRTIRHPFAGGPELSAVAL